MADETTDQEFRVEERDDIFFVYLPGDDEVLASDRVREEALESARAVQERREADRKSGQRTLDRE